jgi:hypothetical protein
MQYILTEQEYKALKAKAENADRLQDRVEDLYAENHGLQADNERLSAECMKRNGRNQNVSMRIPIGQYDLETLAVIKEALRKERNKKNQPYMHQRFKVGLHARGRGPRPSRFYHQHLPQSMAEGVQIYLTVEGKNG